MTRTDSAKANTAAFRLAAARQGRCAVCRLDRERWDAHHVLYMQELRRRAIFPWSPDNALRLCRACHGAHHNRSRTVCVTELPDEAITYVVEQLGPYGVDWLRRYYDDATDPDPRLVDAADRLLPADADPAA